MKLRNLIVICVILLITYSMSAKTFCACCAEPGTYMIRTGKPADYQIDLLKEMKFDKDAFLYMTEAGFESIKGLSSIEKEFDDESWMASPGGMNLVNIFTGKTWSFTIKSPKGKTGTLVLPMPSQMLTFKVDIHDEEDRPNGPLLYKEFRFKGTVLRGTGFFASSIVKPTSYFLVFQGRGNGCDNAEDFNNWNLEITGKNAKYQFFGELKSGRIVVEEIEIP
ncbi:MAG: hypothetical protein ACRD6X_17365 [Pyrinomonadaceae bacterium]